ncbi:YitT family protein [Balneatrix alpica]|uniref:YitT family protein n=1 Tax=Balneatrix alpica TaxID=75684 RepID=A0ABV5Z6U6_9GAMM|nr:YitT family protein [Balneatrix alpica]
MKQRAHAWMGLVEGSFLMALGVLFLQATSVPTGGITGVTLILDRLLPGISFGTLYFLLNLPFYLLAVWEKGWQFTLRTLIAVTLLSVFTDLLSHNVQLQLQYPLWGALASGALLAFGIITLFQHNASSGGFTILVLWLEKRIGLNRGLTLLVIDGMTVGTALFLFGFEQASNALLVIILMGSIIGRYKPNGQTPQGPAKLESPAVKAQATAKH